MVFVLLSRRDSTMVAWHEVPDDVRCEGPFPKHLDFFCSYTRKFRHANTSITESKCAPRQESHRTLRDGSLGWRCPRHFVPGYDRTVPPGQKPFARRCPHIKLALTGLKPRAEFHCPLRGIDGYVLSGDAVPGASYGLVRWSLTLNRYRLTLGTY